DKEIPFTKAAEIGTSKVICEHSTIGIVVTCDGSFGEIPRNNYVKAEERTVSELKKLNKPFVMILNTATPFNPSTKSLALELSRKYGVAVLPINCDQLRQNDVTNILESALYEFPIAQINFFTPPWMEMLSDDHWLKSGVIDSVSRILLGFNKIEDFKTKEIEYENQYIESIRLSQIDLANGNVNLDIKMVPNIYFGIISELTETTINNEYELIQTIRDLSGKKKSLSGMTEAISQVELNGFGVVTPQKDNIFLEEPEIIKNGNKFGVRIKASAPSINLLKTNISVEIAPIVGSEQQAKDLIEYIKENKQANPDGIWETNIFGKTIGQIVDDGIQEKTRNITQESMAKISDTLEKVMNENTGLVCLIV
ncbi:MAG: stage IV sporulation protein A, partial [Lachnospiraceae bacterium]